MADQRVADRHFVEVRQRRNSDEIVEIEIVAGVDAEPERVRELAARVYVANDSRACGSPRSNARANGSV